MGTYVLEIITVRISFDLDLNVVTLDHAYLGFWIYQVSNYLFSLNILFHQFFNFAFRTIFTKVAIFVKINRFQNLTYMFDFFCKTKYLRAKYVSTTLLIKQSLDVKHLKSQLWKIPICSDQNSFIGVRNLVVLENVRLNSIGFFSGKQNY